MSPQSLGKSKVDREFHLGDVDRKEFKKWMKVEIKRFFE
jgi:hypothetical protein